MYIFRYNGGERTVLVLLPFYPHLPFTNLLTKMVNWLPLSDTYLLINTILWIELHILQG